METILILTNDIDKDIDNDIDDGNDQAGAGGINSKYMRPGPRTTPITQWAITITKTLQILILKTITITILTH